MNSSLSSAGNVAILENLSVCPEYTIYEQRKVGGRDKESTDKRNEGVAWDDWLESTYGIKPVVRKRLSYTALV